MFLIGKTFLYYWNNQNHRNMFRLILSAIFSLRQRIQSLENAFSIIQITQVNNTGEDWVVSLNLCFSWELIFYFSPMVFIHHLHVCKIWSLRVLLTCLTCDCICIMENTFPNAWIHCLRLKMTESISRNMFRWFWLTSYLPVQAIIIDIINLLRYIIKS